MHTSPSSALFRSTMLPWLLFLVALVGGGGFIFRTSIARFLMPPANTAIDGQGILKRIQDLNNLEAVAYHMEAIIPQTKDGTWWKLNQDGQKALFVADGSVIAGVDLGKLTADDVRVSENGAVIRIKLPPVQILNVSVTDLKAVNIDTGVFGLVHLDEELRQKALRDGRTRLQEIACNSSILEVARENSQRNVEQLFALLGGVEVLVESPAAPPCQVPTS